MNPHLNDWMRAAETAHRVADFARCNSLCEQILAEDPKHLPATVLLGIVAVKTANFPEAFRLLQRGIRLDAGCFEAHLWLGIARREAGDLDEAVVTLRQALQIWPNNPGALANLGLCYLAQRNGAKAAVTFQRAIAAKPRDPEYHQNLGYAFQQKGEPENAVIAFEESLRLRPDSVPGLVTVGQVYLELTRREDAIRVFRQAYELAPETARGQIQLARALREEGDFSGAETALHQALALEPDSVDALEVVSNLMQQLGRFDDAIAVLDRAIAQDPHRNRLYFNRVFCRRTTPSDAPLVQEMEARVKSSNLDASDRRYLHYALGKAHTDLGNLPPSMAHYEQANVAMRDLLGNKAFERHIHTAEFDKKIATFTPEFFARHQALGNSSERPILIVGMIRSGTSLVEQILSAHPEIAGAGELLFWFQRAHDVVRNQDVSEAAIRRVQADYLSVLQGIDPITARVTDKMPHNYMFCGQIHLAFPRAKIIHCRRHPVDNCLSIFMTPYQVPLDFAHDKSNITFVYREYQRLMDHWRAVLPTENFLEVDYETLVENPEATVRQMIDFVGLEWNEACLHPEDNERAVKTPSMWQVRQPVYKTSTERWRKYEPWLGEFRELM